MAIMTLIELSPVYAQDGKVLKKRLKSLRTKLKTACEPEEIWQLKQRIKVLTEMLTQANDLRELTLHYYERGYYRDKKYII